MRWILVILCATAPIRALAAQGPIPDIQLPEDSIPLVGPESGTVRGQDAHVPTSFRLVPYGSLANFNPLSMLVNRGLDMWQLDQYSPSLVDFPYARSAGNVWRAVTHPRDGVDRLGGVGHFVRNEILPLTWNDGQPAWLANYSLHFFMGGVTYVRTEGWFAEARWPAPKLWAGVSVMAAAYITEMTEGVGSAGAPAFADLVFFDLGGILAFNIPGVRNFVGERMRVMDWSLQPVFTPHGEVYNQGDYFAVKFGLPFSDRVDFLWRVGIGSWFGLSFPRGETDAVSFALGAETLNQRIDEQTLEESVTMGFAGGIFYDRNGSLLGALEWGWRERLVSLNVYPSVLPGPLRDTGIWLSLDRDLRLRAGLSARVIGMGVGLSPRGPNLYNQTGRRN